MKLTPRFLRSTSQRMKPLEERQKRRESITLKSKLPNMGTMGSSTRCLTSRQTRTLSLEPMQQSRLVLRRSMRPLSKMCTSTYVLPSWKTATTKTASSTEKFCSTTSKGGLVWRPSFRLCSTSVRRTPWPATIRLLLTFWTLERSSASMSLLRQTPPKRVKRNQLTQ